HTKIDDDVFPSPIGVIFSLILLN
ncbi:hypothetical protein HMPREF2085_00535, partial [Fusobacterium nucleatum 13_3C]